MVLRFNFRGKRRLQLSMPGLRHELGLPLVCILRRLLHERRSPEELSEEHRLQGRRRSEKELVRWMCNEAEHTKVLDEIREYLFCSYIGVKEITRRSWPDTDIIL